MNGDTDEGLYLRQPPEYEQGDGNLACHLNHGLRQAPRQGHARLKEELELWRFKASEDDPGLLVYTGKHNVVYLQVYVDDILNVSSDTVLLDWAKDIIMTAFDAHYLGEARLYLGVTSDQQARTIKLGQERITAQLPNAMTDAKSASVPLSAAVKLTKDKGNVLDRATWTRADQRPATFSSTMGAR